MIKYDLENYINRKVELHILFDKENTILSVDRERALKVQAELKQKYTVHEGELPCDPAVAAKFLEDCARVIERPATTTEEHIIKAGAALTLVMHLYNEQ